MTTRISRPMDYAGRFGRQQADQAIKRDVIRALVELITNSDDSYRRLESRGKEVDGRITIEVLRKRQQSVFRVTDYGEGMDGQALDQALGVYAEETSGFTVGQPVRGYFGRGVKDAILGLGEGKVIGTVANQVHQAWLGMQDGTAHYKAQRPVSRRDTSPVNSTTVEITVTRDDVTIPRWDNIRSRLLLHFALRDILSSDSRTVVLRLLEASTARSAQEIQLRYQFPKGSLLEEATRTFPESDASCEIVLHRADDLLDTPREQGYNAQAGLLIKGENAIYDNTLLKFDADVNAQRFYGTVKCRYLDDLLRQDQPVLLATRDGLDGAHPFVRRLFGICEEFLEPFVQNEADRARQKVYRAQNRELQDKLASALSRLNEIARNELTDLDIRLPSDLRDPHIPDSGFGFVPEFANVLTARRRTLSLRALTRIIPEGTMATISSDNPNVNVVTPVVVIEPREDYEWFGEAKVSVEGVQVGAEAIITAECEGLTGEAMVRIVARTEPPNGETDPQPRRRGLFGEIRFSGEANPRQRVRYDHDSKDIIVAVNHASVHPYVSDVAGTGTDTPQGQVILAELISEAFCGAIARRGVETGRFAAPVGGEVEAIQRNQLDLQNKHSGLIHEIIVAPEYRAG